MDKSTLAPSLVVAGLYWSECRYSHCVFSVFGSQSWKSNNLYMFQFQLLHVSHGINRYTMPEILRWTGKVNEVILEFSSITVFSINNSCLSLPDFEAAEEMGTYRWSSWGKVRCSDFQSCSTDALRKLGMKTKSPKL